MCFRYPKGNKFEIKTLFNLKLSYSSGVFKQTQISTLYHVKIGKMLYFTFLYCENV